MIAGLLCTSSRGPALYRATRVGRGGETFIMLKFRTMKAGTLGIGVTASDDRRITRVGRVLRTTKLDELPQLFHVVRGTMSLVGPRPEDPKYVAYYSDVERQVLTVPPGITGASVIVDEEKLLAGIPPELVERHYIENVLPVKLAIEVSYIEDWRISDDIWIIMRTALSLIRIDRSGQRSRSLGKRKP